jgi:glutaredoxin 3
MKIRVNPRPLFPLYALCVAASHTQADVATLSPLGGKPHLSVVIYTKPGCPYCQQARDYYDANGIKFIDYDAQNDRARRKEMFAYSGGDPTVPCIVENGKYVGSGWGNPPRG